jgi:hypothetical protein
LEMRSRIGSGGRSKGAWLPLRRAGRSGSRM